MNRADMVRAALRQYVPRGDWYALAGPGNADRRQACMEAMTGQRLPRSQCGLTLLRDIAFAASGVQGNCLAAREDALTAWAAA